MCKAAMSYNNIYKRFGKWSSHGAVLKGIVNHYAFVKTNDKSYIYWVNIHDHCDFVFNQQMFSFHWVYKTLLI